MVVTLPSWDFIAVVEDSRRWRHIELRPDDIVRSTPPKSGAVPQSRQDDEVAMANALALINAEPW